MATIVMWDDDGVISDWTSSFNSFMGWPDKEWSHWYGYRDFGLTDQEFVEHLNRYGNSGQYADLSMCSLALQAFQMLDRWGAMQVLVTDKPEGRAMDDAVSRLVRGGFRFYETVRSRNKTEFLEFVNDGDKSYALDDRPKNVKELRDVGVEAYLLTKTWNVHDDLPRVANPVEFALIVSGGGAV